MDWQYHRLAGWGPGVELATDLAGGGKSCTRSTAKPSLIFVVVEGDLFVKERPKEHIDRVCRTIAASQHIGLLVTKYTAEMAAYFAALDPRTVRRYQSKLWLCFSAGNQEWFDRRWADMRALAEAGWFVFVSIAPMIGPVSLPDDFLALAKWVIVNGECEQIEPERCRPMDAAWVRAILDQCRAAKFRSSCATCIRTDTLRRTCKNPAISVGVASCRSLSQRAVARASNSRCSFLPPELRKRTTIVCPKTRSCPTVEPL